MSVIHLLLLQLFELVNLFNLLIMAVSVLLRIIITYYNFLSSHGFYTYICIAKDVCPSRVDIHTLKKYVGHLELFPVSEARVYRFLASVHFGELPGTHRLDTFVFVRQLSRVTTKPTDMQKRDVQ
jgi:hypothetical protein